MGRAISIRIRIMMRRGVSARIDEQDGRMSRGGVSGKDGWIGVGDKT